MTGTGRLVLALIAVADAICGLLLLWVIRCLLPSLRISHLHYLWLGCRRSPPCPDPHSPVSRYRCPPGGVDLKATQRDFLPRDPISGPWETHETFALQPLDTCDRRSFFFFGIFWRKSNISVRSFKSRGHTSCPPNASLDAALI